MPDDRAIERTREIIGLAGELAADFRFVRDQFESLNRDLRERVMDHEGSRGRILEELFSGVDLIAESESGRTFSAFWRLLTDPEQSASLEQSLDQVLSRSFATRLEPAERRFLLRVTRTLLEEGGKVHEVLRYFARSLRNFVQSREYLEQRRLTQLLNRAQQLGLSLKEEMGAREVIGFELELASGRIRSYAQWALFDPSLGARTGGVRPAETAPIDLDTVSGWVAQSEIDFRELRENILACLRSRGQVSIADVLGRYPASQGLGSVVGYLSLAGKHAVRGADEEQVGWKGMDGVERQGRIPTMYFVKERAHELQ